MEWFYNWYYNYPILEIKTIGFEKSKTVTISINDLEKALRRNRHNVLKFLTYRCDLITQDERSLIQIPFKLIYTNYFESKEYYVL